jgi:uncharacterized protein with FMN-binding domain
MLKFRSVPPHILSRKLRQFLLSSFVILAFVAFAFYERLTASANLQGLNARLGFSPMPLESQAPPQGYRDGLYTGPAMPAGYGKVQVKVFVHNGKLLDVQFIDYPRDRQTSQQINDQAMPWLKQEAIQAQGANVNVISGATLTSKAFVDSLQSALQSAQN